MSRRNRTAGSSYERAIAQEFRAMGYEAVTSRQESRSADARGIDLITDFPLAPQMKSACNQPNFHTLLTETDAEIVFFRKTEKRGTRFYEVGQYVCLEKEMFYELIKKKET